VALAPTATFWLYDFLKIFGKFGPFCDKKFGMYLSVKVMIMRKIYFIKSVNKDQTFLKFLGYFVLSIKKIWDGLSIPKRYFVLGTLCPKDHSVPGTLQPWAL
jgi:hypothetical protein